MVARTKKISGDRIQIEGAFTNSNFIKSILGVTDIYKNSELQSWLTILRNSDNYVDSSFKMPAIEKFTHICRTTLNIRVLESLIPNEVMEMLHAGDTRSALQALGVQDETKTSIIESLTRTLRKELDQQQRKYNNNDNTLTTVIKITKITNNKNDNTITMSITMTMTTITMTVKIRGAIQ